MKNQDRRMSFILFLIGVLPFLYLIIDLCLIDPSTIRSINNPNTIAQIKKDLSNILYKNNNSNLFIKKQIAKKSMSLWQEYLLDYRNFFEGILFLDSKKNILYWITIGSIYKTNPSFNIVNYSKNDQEFIMYDSLNKKRWSSSKQGKYSIEDALKGLLSSYKTKWKKVSKKTKLPLNLFYMRHSIHSKSRKYRICQLQNFRYPDKNYSLIFIKKPNFLLEQIDESISKDFPNYLITIKQSQRNKKIKLKYHFLTGQEVKSLYKEVVLLQAKLPELQFKLNNSKTLNKIAKNLIVSNIEATSEKINQINYLLKKRGQLDEEKLFRYKVLEVDLHGFRITLYDNKSPWFRARIQKIVSKPSWQLIILFLCPIIILFILFYRYAKKDETYLLQNDWIDYLAHEIQTPIHGINICAELLQDSKDKNLIKLIQSQATQLNYVAKAFIRSVQANKFELIPKIEKIILNEIIKNSWDMVFKVHEDKNPEIFIEGAEIELVLDSKMFQEFFINLFDNSCKYCSENPSILIKVIKSSKGLEILVQDNGIGIESKFYGKVFQKSYRIQNQWNLGVTGTGMGLYLANEIVSAHQGVFTIEKSSSQGTTFKACLPL